MEKQFDFEELLVKSFINNYNKSEHEIIIKEMPIRFGNIDIVSIKNSTLPFKKDQIEVLSKPASALIFSKIKNERPISKNTLVRTVGLSKATIDKVLYELLNSNLIVKKKNNYLRERSFKFPKTTIIGYEAKLKDFNKAFYQAKNNKEFIDYSYLVFPEHIARKLIISKKELLKTRGIGLIGVNENENITLLKAKKLKGPNNHIRLLNITKANVLKECNSKNIAG